MSAHMRKHRIKETSCSEFKKTHDEQSVSWREAFQ